MEGLLGIKHVEYDGKFTVNYITNDGDESAFRVHPDFGRLIGAAPDLLLACVNANDLLGIICEGVCKNNPPPGGVERLKMLRDAISKATGM